MRGKIYTFSELKESKLIYDRKPPAFGLIITFLTLAFVVGAILWACLSVKTYVVKATGLVTDDTKVYVMNSVAGEIKTIEVVEGQEVSEGDVILTLDTFQTDLQIAQLQAMVDLYATYIENSQKLISFVNDYSIDNTDTQVNPFDSTVVEELSFYNDAELFKLYVQSLTETDEDEEDENENENEDSVEYTDEDLASLKIQFLVQQSTYTYLTEYISQYKQYSSQLEMYNESLSAYTVVATQSGVIHLSSGLAVGAVLSSSTLLATISSDDSENLYFQVSVSASERSKLSVGSEVEIAVSGASQTEYGTLSGTIVSIDNDVTQTEDGDVYYVVKIVPDSTVLTDKGGNEINLQLGMLGECRIKYDDTTWMNWIVEQIVGKLY